MDRRQQPRPRFTDSLTGAFLATFGVGLLLGLAVRDIPRPLGPEPDQENAMQLKLNGKAVPATVAVDSQTLAFEYRNPETGRMELLELDGNQLVLELDSMGVAVGWDWSSAVRGPAAGHGGAEPPPDPAARQVINELAGGDTEELDEDAREAHRERPDAGAEPAS